MKKLVLLALSLLAVGNVSAQTTASLGVASFYGVSAANTAQQVVFDLRNIHDTLAINAVCSAGTAALNVDGGVDGSIFLGIDAISAASPQVKQYTATTVGATIALSPLSFRYVRITIATCGSSNTSTLTVSAK